MKNIILPVILMGLFLAYTLYVIMKRKAGMGPAFRMFFERTGYRYADIPDAPLEQHITHGEELMRKAGQGYHIHMVRDFHSLPVHCIQDAGPTDDGKGWFMSSSWMTPLSRPPRVLVQVADKNLSGAGKAIKEAFSNSKRIWNAVYSQTVPLADPELSKRFNCYAEDPQAAARVMAAPGLKELLLGFAQVDIIVDQKEIRFADPLQKNITSAMGGTVGMMAVGANMQKTMELSIPVHDRMAEVLATLAKACA